MKLTTQRLKKLIKEELEDMEQQGPDEGKIIKLIASNNEEKYAEAMSLFNSAPDLKNNKKLIKFIYDHALTRAFEDAMVTVHATGGEETRWMAKHSPLYVKSYDENVQYLYETFEDYL
jgi:hypothetical protein